MSAAPVDLDAYFARIGYAGPRQPTLETLRALHRLHPAAIAFEAIDVLLGRGVNLEPAAVDAKLIAAGRGGYCFEHNSLFKRVLSALGFEVAGLIARVRWGRPLTDVGPRSHMVLRVRLAGEDWLADVGFGGCMLTAPVRLGVRGSQETWFEPVRLVPVAGELRLDVRIAGAWMPICDIVRQVQRDEDFIAPNWFTSTHPTSRFGRVLIVSLTTPAARYALLDNRLTIRRPGVEPERRRLGADELERSLSLDFGLPVERAWRPVLRRAVSAGDAWNAGRLS